MGQDSKVLLKIYTRDPFQQRFSQNILHPSHLNQLIFRKTSFILDMRKSRVTFFEHFVHFVMKLFLSFLCHLLVNILILLWTYLHLPNPAVLVWQVKSYTWPNLVVSRWLILLGVWKHNLRILCMVNFLYLDNEKDETIDNNSS